MGDAEALDLLRETYEQALADYEATCSALSRHLVIGQKPREEVLQREQEARVILEAARRSYLDAWMLP